MTCEQNNSTHINSNCYFTVTPDTDSIALNQPMEIKLNLPKKFIEETYGKPVEFHKDEIFAAMSIIVIDSSGTGAVNFFDATALAGKLYRDTTSNNTEYFRNKNFTASAILQPGDSMLRAHYILKPLRKGNYSFAFSHFGKKDVDCSLFRYYAKPQVADQHLYLLAAITGGYVGDYERTYAYCFKVY